MKENSLTLKKAGGIRYPVETIINIDLVLFANTIGQTEFLLDGLE